MPDPTDPRTPAELRAAAEALVRLAEAKERFTHGAYSVDAIGTLRHAGAVSKFDNTSVGFLIRKLRTGDPLASDLLDCLVAFRAHVQGGA